MSVPEMLLVAITIPLGLAVLAFWIWMLVDCLRYRGEADLDRLLWAFVLVFLKVFGALFYYFLRYRPRRRDALRQPA